MLDSPEMDKLLDKFQAWFFGHVWTAGTFTQGAVVVMAAALAWLLYHLTAHHISRAIVHLNISPRLKAVMHNVRRLVFPLAMLILLFIVDLTGSTEQNPINMDLIGAVMNLLLAWIAIKLAVQFIGNSFMRNVFAISIWSIAALSILGFLPAVEKSLDHAALSIGNVHVTALSLVKAMFALCFLLYGAIFVSSLIERQIRLSKSLSPSSKVLISKSVRILLVVIALLVGIVSAGIDLSLLAAFSGGIGLGIGFGLQKVISNLISGMMLLLDESIKPGDIIELQDGAFGWVEKMGARYTEVVTHDFKSYLIPNETLVTQQVVNWSHGNTLIRLEVDFGVHYKSDPRQVKALAKEVAARLPRIVTDPPPVCHLVQFGDSSINFKLRFWISDAENDIADVRSLMLLGLWDAFKENGIEIPYPQRVVHMHDADEKAA